MTGRDVLYIVEERALRRPTLITDVGVRLPAHLTATGRAMLAALPREQVRALYPDATAFTQRTGGGPTRPRELNELLREVRREGVAREDGEITAGFRSVGIAVRDHVDWPVAAVAMTWADDAPVDETAIVAAVADTARQLQRRLGYTARTG
jgi:DNA-binding IclR family transcriptional regulator